MSAKGSTSSGRKYESTLWAVWYSWIRVDGGAYLNTLISYLIEIELIIIVVNERILGWYRAKLASPALAYSGPSTSN